MLWFYFVSDINFMCLKYASEDLLGIYLYLYIYVLL